MEPDSTQLRERLASLPERPGVYLFKDASSRFLYVGKAANLRNRVRSYFGAPLGLAPKVRRMVQWASDFEFVVTDSESEALILENTLIKRHHPRFNTRLRDDKTYPFIKVDLREDFPLVYFTRAVRNDGARYFGPFANAGSVRRTLDLLKKLFPYRSCTKVITGTDARPCLEYDIGRCVAPCAGHASREEYGHVIRQVLMFLDGNTTEVVKQLRSRMTLAAGTLDYERAARIRDQIQAIQRVGEEQKVASSRGKDSDIIAIAQERDEAWVEAFFVREGKLVGRDRFIMDGTQDEAPAHVLTNFLKQFYARASSIPSLVLTQHPVEDADLVTTWLSARRGGPVALRVPVRGENRRLMAMVADNAAQGLSVSRLRRSSDREALDSALRELQEALSLPRPPKCIECYDISNIRGTDAVGSMVVFQDGRPRKEHYRRFRVKTVDEIDDYAMMREVLTRRFGRLAKDGALVTPAVDHDGQPSDGDGQTWGIVPDLVLIDGGKGHLSAVLGVFLDLGVSTEAVPLASLAKEEEEIFMPHSAEAVLLPRNSQGLFLVQRVRDEAHRFAITYHRQLRSNRQVRSELEGVPGIGPKRRRMLTLRFGGAAGVREASVEELSTVPGMTVALAKRLKERL